MTAILSDFFIIMISISLFGCLFQLFTVGLLIILRLSACQRYIFYKGILFYYLMAPLLLIMFFIASTGNTWLMTTGGDWKEWILSSLPISYRFYGYYKELAFIPYVTALWLVGMLLFLFCQLWGIFQLKRLRKNSGENQRSELGALCKKLAEEHQIRKAIKIVDSDQISSPFLAGISNPTIFLPRKLFMGKPGLAVCSREEMRFILRHEMIHCSQRDIFYKMLCNTVKSMYWFNPLIYLFARNLEECSEMACDEILLEREGWNKRYSYGRCIMRFTENRMLLSHSTGISFGNIVEKRIGAIADMRKGHVERKRQLLLLLVICLFFVVTILSLKNSMIFRTMLGAWMESIYFSEM